MPAFVPGYTAVGAPKAEGVNRENDVTQLNSCTANDDGSVDALLWTTVGRKKPFEIHVSILDANNAVLLYDNELRWIRIVPHEDEWQYHINIPAGILPIAVLTFEAELVFAQHKEYINIVLTIPDSSFHVISDLDEDRGGGVSSLNVEATLRGPRGLKGDKGDPGESSILTEGQLEGIQHGRDPGSDNPFVTELALINEGITIDGGLL
jgi:hypothetical protein